eukprot:6211019-Pleurochrysis_carterae.AAC.2
MAETGASDEAASPNAISEEERAAALQKHKKIFERKFADGLASLKGGNTGVIDRQELAQIHEVLITWNSRQAADWKHLGGHKIYQGIKKYMLAAIGAETFVCFAEKGGSSSTDDKDQGEAAALDSLQRVIAKEDVFDAIYPVHAEGGHKKARSFQTAVKAKFGKSVPNWVCDLLCETCPVRIRKIARKPTIAELWISRAGTLLLSACIPSKPSFSFLLPGMCP